MFPKLVFFAVLGFVFCADPDRLAAPGQFPYHASVQLDGEHQCSGAIVSPTVILTSANCLLDYSLDPLDASRVSAVVGTTNKSEGGVRASVANISINPAYNSVTGDIGAITLASALPVKLGSNIDAIGLQTEQVPVGFPVVISAWGFESRTQLRYNTYTTLSQSQCANRNYVSTNLWLCVTCRTDTNRLCNNENGAPSAYEGKLASISGRLQDNGANIAEHMKWIKTICKLCYGK